MGYFSNATEGGLWEAENCTHCPADKDKCPILMAHMVYNYDQHKEQNEDLLGALAILIHREDDTGRNTACAMLEALKGNPDQHTLPGFKVVEINSENGG